MTEHLAHIGGIAALVFIGGGIVLTAIDYYRLTRKDGW